MTFLAGLRPVVINALRYFELQLRQRGGGAVVI